METDEYCIVQIFGADKETPSINEVVKVFYNNKYIDKYSKIIDKDKIYLVDEANEILKNNSTCGFVISTRENSKGSDMIEELAYLEERSELNFETLNWDSIEDYIKEIEEQGYSSEKLTKKEFEQWFEWRYK